MVESRQSHVRAMQKVIEQLRERFELSDNKLFSSTASPHLKISSQLKDLIISDSPFLSHTDSKQMFEKEVKNFAY